MVGEAFSLLILVVVDVGVGIEDEEPGGVTLPLGSRSPRRLDGRCKGVEGRWSDMDDEELRLEELAGLLLVLTPLLHDELNW